MRTRSALRLRPGPLVIAALLLLCGWAPRLAAQGQFRPTQCPNTVTERTLGILSFWHAGYTWPGTWKIAGPTMREGEGFYTPASGLSYVISLNGKAIWENAGIIVNCQVEEWWDGFGLRVRVWYHVHGYVGRVRERCASGGTADDRLIGDHGEAMYDPYADAEGDASSDPDYVDPSYYRVGTDGSLIPTYTEADLGTFGSWGSCASGGGSGGEGTGSGGSGCSMQYVRVEVSNDGGDTWSVLWEGYAAVCG